MADIHTPNFYPDTAFINSYITEPNEVDLARAVYVADFFSDGSPLLQRTFSTIASHELVSPHDERQEQLNRAADRISDLMGTSFAEILAKGDQPSDSPTYEASAVEAKGETLTRIWNMMRESPFMRKVAEARENGRDLTEKELQVGPRNTTHADDALLYYDYARLDPKNADRHPDDPAPQSVVREAILELRGTGVASIDDYLRQLRRYSFIGTFAAPLSAIRSRWEYWHPDQEFFTEGYRANQKDARSTVRLLARPIATSILSVLSRRLWQGVERDVAKWEEIVLRASISSDSPEA